MEYLFPHISAKPLFTLFIFLFKLSNCGTIPETTIEFSSDSRGIANSIIDLEVWLDVFLLRISFAAVCCMVWSGLSSRKVAWTWATIQLTLAPGNGWILTRYLCLTFLWGDNHIVSWAYCLLECMQFWVFPMSCYWCCFCSSCHFLVVLAFRVVHTRSIYLNHLYHWKYCFLTFLVSSKCSCDFA